LLGLLAEVVVQWAVLDADCLLSVAVLDLLEVRLPLQVVVMVALFVVVAAKGQRAVTEALLVVVTMVAQMQAQEDGRAQWGSEWT
jgi:hypothetical protein